RRELVHVEVGAVRAGDRGVFDDGDRRVRLAERLLAERSGRHDVAGVRRQGGGHRAHGHPSAGAGERRKHDRGAGRSENLTTGNLHGTSLSRRCAPVLPPVRYPETANVARIRCAATPVAAPASVPIPKFVSICSTLRTNFGIERTLATL